MIDVSTVKEELLEEVVNGLPCEEIRLGYYQGSKRIEEPEAYFLRIQMNKEPVMLIPNDNGLIPVPFGFRRTPSYMKSAFYVCNNEGGLTQVEHDKKRYWIPLERTNFFSQIRKGKEVSEETFEVMGVDGSLGVKPCLFISETERGFDCRHLVYKEGIQFAETQVKPKKDMLGRLARDQYISEVIPVLYAESMDCTDAQEVFAYLNKRVVGQEKAKKVLSVALSSYLRARDAGREHVSEGIVLVGNTGSGKSLLCSILGSIAPVPYVSTPVSATSPEGYYGEDLKNAFRVIAEQTEEHKPYAVVNFDEGDKPVKGELFGTSLQNEMMRFIEGSDIEIDHRKRDHIHTGNMLFIVSGSFEGLDEASSLEGIAAERAGRKRAGFKKESQEEYARIVAEDFIKFGWLPELVGRLPHIAHLQPLNQDQLLQTLDLPTSPLKKTKADLQLMDFSLEVEKAARDALVNACEPETGTRALANAWSALHTDLLFDPKAFAKGKEIKITEETVRPYFT